MEKTIAAFILDAREEETPEPVYPITAIPEGLGEAITPASLAAMCADALDMGSVWPWQIGDDTRGHGRERSIPVIPVRHRWKVGFPPQLWVAGGPCQSYPAAFLADWTFLLEDRGHEEREARRRAPQPKGWRAIWHRRFPSSRNPPIRPEDQLWKPPPGYFRIPRGDASNLVLP